MEWWMLLAAGFLLLGIGGIVTGIQLSKRSEKTFKAKRGETNKSRTGTRSQREKRGER